jgi:5-methylcytosine-specific restriction endonuclease McrA
MTKREVREGRVRLPLWAFLRIAAECNYMCHWCGTGYNVTDPWEVDHKVSLASGGTNHMANLALCHRSCNRDKGALSVAS